MILIYRLENMQAAIETTATNVDTFIDKALAPTPTPWYLKSEDLYLLTKKALTDMNLGDYTVIKKAITIVDKSTEMLVGKLTTYTVEEGFSVLKVIDETLAIYCPKADEAVDATHVKFLDALKGLKAATKAQVEAIYAKLSVEEAKAYAIAMTNGTYALAKEKADVTYAVAKEKAPVAVETVEKLLMKADELKNTTTNYVKDTYAAASEKISATKEATTVFAKNTYLAANEKLTATKEATTDFVKNTYTTANQKIIATKDATVEFANTKVEQVKGVSADVLKTAEPYGKAALDASKPYIMKAVDISSPVVAPIVDNATPYVTPYVEYAKKTIEGNETVAPLYKSVEKMVGNVKEFYTSENATPIVVE